ncbi:Poly(A) RNA polymerase cid14, putative [Theobroma cacao]|uniref:Poly(A) RNA polymerase cid14, putative n=1 Tax=Theobroma cacao TaxID=3641 RepID=A0A061DSI5_THECC|nr:Poly(A) RNA polymerase cid14, putative [Theobroma cacao]
MEENEGWAAQQPPSELLPNGLLPNETASVIQILDSERWMKAEERTADLIARIQPNAPSEKRRKDVAEYVQGLICQCFPCQVFTFGSVPLKTYLPDGDIDLTAFSENQNLKDTWAHQVRDMLENEEKNENAKFLVKEVQYIQAEVKIIKCLVENIVVDISFNQLGGLCTLCFLEEVDLLINQNHLFKRSIILIKAWCYYESRILGAHHGLISTYALETLVLYIFHVFNKSFSGPLEVLYYFLEFFSKFDWENFCVSLWGPVPISSLPDITAEPPRKDGGELLLSKYFLDTCSSRYAVCQENQGQPFVSKHFNVIDPLRINNNLGRSVSKGNFFRIRSAFAFGAKKLARLLDPKEDLYDEVNQFFMNTWERHGSGERPDAPRNDLWRLGLSNSDHTHGSKNVRNNSSSKVNDMSSGHETQAEGAQGLCGVSSQHVNYPSECTSKISDVSTASRAQSQKSYGSMSNSNTSDQVRRDSNSNQNVHNDTGQRNSKAENIVTDVQGRYLFARTRSSPELTETYGEVASRGRRNRVPESGKTHIASMRSDNNGRKNMESDMTASNNIKSSCDDPSSIRHTSTHQSIDATADPNSLLNSYQDDLGLGAMGQDFSSIPGAQGMHQEEQDLVNMMASSTAHGFNGQVPIPLNLAAGHLPFPIQSSGLATMGNNQRNLGGIVPTNIHMFPQRLVSSPLAHYFSGIGLASNPEDSIEPGSENFGSSEMNPGEAEHELWHEQDRGSSGGFDLDNGSFEMLQSDDKQLSTSGGYNFDPSSRVGSSGSSTKVQQKFTKETRGSNREDHVDVCQYQDNRGNDVYFDERTASSRSMPASHSSSLRSKTSSENSWEGSSAKVSKPAREKRGRKTAASALPSAACGKGKSVSEHSSQAGDDGRDWNLPPTVGTEMAERTSGPQPVGSLPVPRHQMPGFEAAQTSGSDSLIPMAPILLGPGSGQRAMDNSGVPPLAFTITGPPIPFFLCPVYNIPAETGTPDASTSHFSWDEGLDNNDSGQNFDSSEGLDQSDVLSTSSSTRKVASLKPSESKRDILNGDIASHWKNLQYGRICQNSRYRPPLIYPSSVMVPPVCLQGHFPWDGPGRPLSTDVNLFSQLMNYGPRVVPVTPFQSVSNRPASVYQRYADEMPRYRGGTGTYLPNPKVPMRERHSTNTRRGKYNYDRNDHHGDREGNWTANSKSRAAGRSHSRNQNEKSRFTIDHLAAVAGESRAERPWSSHRHDSFTSYQSHNGPVRSNSSQSSSASMPYGMYPLPAMNPSGVSSNGPTIPSVVMLYPYDHNSGYSSPAEQLEFGSLGPVGFPGMNEVSQLSDGSSSGGVFDEQRFHGSSAQQSSPDQPSSPHLQRGL